MHELAKVITSEARDVPSPAPEAVGHVVLTRMRRGGFTYVHQVWGAFSHVAGPRADYVTLARRILTGDVPDPTGGATHFYTPRRTPREGEPTAGRDVGGGLESVPGVEAGPDHHPARNYRPSWTVSPGWTQMPVPGIDESVFKFYRQPGDGRVH